MTYRILLYPPTVFHGDIDFLSCSADDIEILWSDYIYLTVKTIHVTSKRANKEHAMVKGSVVGAVKFGKANFAA